MSVRTASPEPYGGFDVLRALAPVRRALGLERIVRDGLLGFAAGAVVGVALLLARHLDAFGLAVPLAIAAAVVGLAAGVTLALLRWPGPLEAARAADHHFALSDRLTTALELRSSQTPMAALQRHDVEERVQDLPLARGSRGPWLARREAAAVALAALAFAAALAFGPTSGGAHRARAAAPSASQKARHAAAQQVRALSANLQKGLTPAQLQTPALRKLQLALSHLQRQLLNASSQRAALRAVSATQQQLHQLALGLHPINGKAVAQLNSSLSRYLGSARTGTRARTQIPSSTRSAQATAQALSRLAQSLAHLTPAQRAALARALARASNATSSTTLRSGLRQAAQALASGDPQSARASLQQTAQALSQSSAMQAALSQLGTAGTQLTTLKGQIAGLNQSINPGAGQSRAGKPGATSGARGRGAGRTGLLGQGAGRRPGQGRGTGFRGQGAGRRAGQGQGQGNRQGAGQGNRPGVTGRGVSGARGPGGTGRANPTRNTRARVTVYIPGKQGKGTQALLTGPNGAPIPGAIVPYSQVIGQYSQSAHQALDRSSLPPSLQQDVLRYFNALSH